MTTDDALVSVIIIFLNEERFLAEAIESVRTQTYPHWELILVDDGSTDRSSIMARGYAAGQPDRIRYVEHDGHANLGMSASRNLGLDQVRGTYVGFLDADDIWLPAKLADQVAIMEAYPDVGMVYGRTLIWHSWRRDGNAIVADEYCELGLQPDTVVEPPQLLVNLIDNRAQTPTTCNALLRSRIFTQAGRFEAAFRGMFEDQVFFMKVALTARVFVSSTTWAWYRQRDDSSSAHAEASGVVPEMRLRLLEWLEEYLRHLDVTSRPVWRALGRQKFAARWPALYGFYARCGRAGRALASHVSR